MIKVSIIVPIYNVEKYLARCLDSLVNQTLKDIEIIAVNDGATDGSQLIVEEYQKRYPDLIKSYIKENGGLSDARNYGIPLADGEYLAFIDSDDWVDVDMFELMYEKAINANADVVACDLDYVYDDGTFKKSCGGDFDVVYVRENPLIAFINNSACNKIYRQQLFDEIRFPLGLWYEDMGTIPKVLLSSTIVAKVDRAFYKYYQRSTSIVHSANDKVFDIYINLNEIGKYITAHVPFADQPQMQNMLKQLYVIHGADLTTLRIREFDKDRVFYLKRNLKLLNTYCPDWYDRNLVASYPFKKRILFRLLKGGRFCLLLWIFDRVGGANRRAD